MLGYSAAVVIGRAKVNGDAVRIGVLQELWCLVGQRSLMTR
jgi:hypothetical protein